ncbi:MAG: hypothetical protein U0350_20320 [Caldilineaceae bacterium]
MFRLNLKWFRSLMLILATLVLFLPAGASAQDAAANAQAAAAKRDREGVSFQLVANPKFLACLARDPNDKKHPPTAEVRVVKGNLNDRMTVRLHNIKPNLAFDLFTVQRSPFKADGSADPGFTNFGLAWYQSDLESNRGGEGDVEIKTILLNQIFGFDPDVNLAPTNTFHVGFWFNNPADAAPCGFTGSTPFNGEHNAGPLAMISLPDANTNLGPLCINPNTSTNPVSCNP